MNNDKNISKSLSYWLRHKPDDGGLTLDPSGWAEVAAVCRALANAQLPDGMDDLSRVVAESDKQRLEISEDGLQIRARQGHSVPVDLDWPVEVPPAFLYHGTVERFLPAILAQGLRPMKRHHVHLSPDIDTATIVARRRGQPVILRVAAQDIAAAGIEFRVSSNGVWLVAAVPPEFLKVAE